MIVVWTAIVLAEVLLFLIGSVVVYFYCTEIWALRNHNAIDQRDPTGGQRTNP